eukprot:5546498-Alexandrium_andersonii.AAC.1
MSASLVGSEMCIRDRDPPISASGAPEALIGWVRGSGSPPGRAAGGPGRPVSYTHLTLPTICSV